MIQRRCAYALIGAAFAFMVGSGGAALAQRNDDKKASVSLKATPPVGFSPLRVRVAAEIRGGAEDARDLYCPAIEWDWGDEQASESSEDCDPYQAGTTTIRRRYSLEHVFRQSGTYTVRFRMKQGDRIVGSASTNVTVRDGLREDIGE